MTTYVASIQLDVFRTHVNLINILNFTRSPKLVLTLVYKFNFDEPSGSSGSHLIFTFRFN
jgi:hypothetical protein